MERIAQLETDLRTANVQALEARANPHRFTDDEVVEIYKNISRLERAIARACTKIAA